MTVAGSRYADESALGRFGVISSRSRNPLCGLSLGEHWAGYSAGEVLSDVPGSMIAIVSEVLDRHPCIEQARPVAAVKALLLRRLLNGLCVLLHGAPGPYVRDPRRARQNGGSTC